MSKLTYKECLIDVGVLGTHAEAFQELHAKISGRAGEFGTIAKPVSTHFGGLVGESLKGVATENHEAWSSSMMACIHAYGIIQKVISDVEWYEEEIESIKADLASALGALPSTGDELEDASIRNAAVIHYNELADEAWRKLEKRCETTEERLGEGPTPENIQELIAAGHIGSNLAYATTEDIDYFYFEESDAVTMANFFKTAVEGHGGSIDALDGQLVLLNALVLKALQAQQNGEKLSDNEIDFLEALFAELEIEENQVEQLGGGSTPQDFLDFVDSLNESEHIDDRTKEDINSGLASSMLILSDESLGGGYESIPDSIREVVEGPELPSGNHSEWISDSNAWAENFQILSEFLSSSDQGTKGGTDISVTLMATSARMLSHADTESPYIFSVPQEVFSDVIEVATRNEDASYVLITGSMPGDEGFGEEDYKFLGNNVDASPDWILERLYKFDWEDGGQAVSKITDWIPNGHEGDDERKTNMAGDAAYALINMLADGEEGKNIFKNTGISIDGNPNASVGEVNPALADSFASVYISYIDDFSVNSGESGYGPLNKSDGEGLLFHDLDEDVLVLPEKTKQDFIQLIVSNEDVSPRVIAATEAQEWRIIEETFRREALNPRAGGEIAGDLRGLVTEAIIQEHLDREKGIDVAREAARKQWETGYGVFSAVVSNAAGGPGGVGGGIVADVVLEALKEPFLKFADSEIKEQIPQSEYLQNSQGEDTDLGDFVLRGRQEAHHHAVLQMANVFLDMGVIDIEELKEKDVLVEYPNGDTGLPVTTAEWGGSTSERSADLLDVIRNASLNYDGADPIRDVDEYIDGYDISYAPPSLGRVGN